MESTANPIYKHAPEEYFLTAPALDVAKAIRRDDVAGLDRLFAEHPTLDPNLEGKQGVTFLFWAYAHHHVKSMRALVAHKADVNRPLHLPGNDGGVGTTHLINIAAEGPKDELLVALLDLGADPNARDERKEPALHNAMAAHQYQRMKLLLDRGATIDAPNSAGATAAVVLARLNYFEMVHYLLERGADWRKTDGEIALWTQENDVGNAEAVQWQIKVKHWLMAHGVKFPVPSSGAKRYAAIRERWEQTPEGRTWREKLDALGARPDVVGKPWVQQEDAARAAMKAWMKQQGIPEPPFFTPSQPGSK
ncbi:ankyrin repeat domain-containing protein [Hymenobacter lucidus]|uniref:Ankyrin repeat domain-containing protein n=1 Tax=Hymenobacter lucidus TaxID=2880930 RepID=A0ABS8AT44_9BACT|nr:ankyrin repeat domain-containing protein [Hymenobacter lucidus]MCB2409387.1 ankyrin repeat domain-containing protein [Hymenobacter lucidus]